MHTKKDTSWENSDRWYKQTVGEEGHFYHQTLVLPGVARLLQLKKGDSLLDIGCGQGILERHIPREAGYCGIDLSPSLVQEAKRLCKSKEREFHVADATKPFSLTHAPFSHAAILLALQNMREPLAVFQNAARFLQDQGRFVIVLNHPCFRIPRQSSWKVEEQQKLQYRRIDRYASTMEIPIATHPGKGDKSPTTFSFHWPLSQLTQWLKQAGFCILDIEEWYSNKESTGKNAKMENRARDEIPLFMTLVCEKRK